MLHDQSAFVGCCATNLGSACVPSRQWRGIASRSLLEGGSRRPWSCRWVTIGIYVHENESDFEAGWVRGHRLI